MVDIVQLVERQIVDLVVAGSSPVIHPIKRVSPNTGDIFYFILIFTTDSNQGSPLVGRTALERSRITLKQQAVVIS